MKILYVTTLGTTMVFFRNLIKDLIDEGHIVDIATNDNVSPVQDCYREWGCKIYQIPTSRSPFSIGNIKAISAIKKIAAHYDIVHCHTPLASMATRLACRKLRKIKGLRVIYTAHGFHFYKGAPKKNWIIYYPIEKICSKWTDVIITINKEDFAFAKRKMKAKKIVYIPGVGIDVKSFKNHVTDIGKKRDEINVPKDAYMILSVGELNENKNQQIVIRAISKLHDNSNVHYVIAGPGNQDGLASLAKELNVNLHLLGSRKDVADLYKCADIYVLPSIREGLNVSIMEAIASGCPTIASKIRGNVDMVGEENCFSPFDVDTLCPLLFKKGIKNVLNVSDIDYPVINDEVKRVYEVDE